MTDPFHEIAGIDSPILDPGAHVDQQPGAVIDAASASGLAGKWNESPMSPPCTARSG